MSHQADDPRASHYDVLGVEATASDSEVRSAYLRLARANHPDVVGPNADSAAVPAVAGRMARINEAWRVLGDPGRRSIYDAGRHAGARATGGTIWEAGNDFRPIDERDVEDWVDPRLLDDAPSGAGLPRVLTFLPVVLASCGVVVLFLGVVLDFLLPMQLGLLLLVGSALSFLLIPVIAMLNSSRADPP